MKTMKYVLLCGGLGIISVSFFGLYSAFAPRTGPIGNGPHLGWIWFNFAVFSLTGLGFLVQAGMMFWQQYKKV